jgi:hypothetical protein
MLIYLAVQPRIHAIYGCGARHHPCWPDAPVTADIRLFIVLSLSLNWYRLSLYQIILYQNSMTKKVGLSSFCPGFGNIQGCAAQKKRKL